MGSNTILEEWNPVEAVKIKGIPTRCSGRTGTPLPMRRRWPLEIPIPRKPVCFWPGWTGGMGKLRKHY